ncbi:hypothetical protein KJ644_03370 [Candidatus Dependentiae bacterium]|nr:hypothetical protein [Candidatus Dependentiae bacterium]MBU4387486.1 hypothetical protein [Candidatus Dependentiae bacterium]MCG2756137.1 hypothetical protein [Candidatus Dependentiae bacterium]
MNFLKNLKRILSICLFILFMSVSLGFTQDFIWFVAPYQNNLYLKIIDMRDNCTKQNLNLDNFRRYEPQNSSIVVYSKEIGRYNNVWEVDQDLQDIQVNQDIMITQNNLTDLVNQKLNSNTPVYFFSDIQGQYLSSGKDVKAFTEGKRGSAAPFLRDLLNNILNGQKATFISVGDIVSNTCEKSGRGSSRNYGLEWKKIFLTMYDVLNGSILTSAMGLPHDIGALEGIMKPSYNVNSFYPLFNSIFNNPDVPESTQSVVKPIVQIRQTKNAFIKDRMYYLNLPISTEELGKKYNFSIDNDFETEIIAMINTANAAKQQGNVDFIVAYFHLPFYTHYRYQHPGMINILNDDSFYIKHIKDIDVSQLNNITNAILDSQIDVCISGHNHTYEHDTIQKNGELGLIHSYIIGTGTDQRPIKYSKKINLKRSEDFQDIKAEIRGCNNLDSRRTLETRNELWQSVEGEGTMATIKTEKIKGIFGGEFAYLPSFFKAYRTAVEGEPVRLHLEFTGFDYDKNQIEILDNLVLDLQQKRD